MSTVCVKRIVASTIVLPAESPLPGAPQVGRPEAQRTAVMREQQSHLVNAAVPSCKALHIFTSLAVLYTAQCNRLKDLRANNASENIFVECKDEGHV